MIWLSVGGLEKIMLQERNVGPVEILCMMYFLQPHPVRFTPALALFIHILEWDDGYHNIYMITY